VVKRPLEILAHRLLPDWLATALEDHICAWSAIPTAEVFLLDSLLNSGWPILQGLQVQRLIHLPKGLVDDLNWLEY